ncbi:MAG: hypothetical protein AAGI38_20280 [Bacteroidota bacterium]
MAKRFLHTIGEAFEEDVLLDVIPHKRPARRKRRLSQAPNPTTDATLGMIDEMSKGSRGISERKSTIKKRKKGFLDAIGSAMEDPSLEQVAARPPRRKTKSQSVETQLSLNVDAAIVRNMRKRAQQQGMSLKEAAQEAFKAYLEQLQNS